MSGYVELLCRSNFSFLRGASHPAELVHRAARLGHRGIGIADDSSLAGVVRAHQAAQTCGLHFLPGARLQLLDVPKDVPERAPTRSPEIVLYPMHRKGYGHLCRLITTGRRRAPKGQCHLSFDDMAEFSGDLICMVVFQRTWSNQDLPILHRYRELFGDRCYLAISRHLGDDDTTIERGFELAQRCSLSALASNDVHYHIRARQPMQDVLTCIREGVTLREAGERLFANGERHLKSERRMLRLFRGHEDAVARTVEVAERCSFSLDQLRYEYPCEICPKGMSHAAYLRKLTLEGATNRYPEGVPARVSVLIEKELGLIADLAYEPYFLTVYDIVRFARSQGILCQGRGSAANSAVCFCLGITSVDPAHHDMLFERFISKERAEPPDIDVDFENERREEVMQYIYNRFGRERAGLTAVVITYRRKSAMREVAKVFGLSLDQANALSRNVDNLDDHNIRSARLREAGFDASDRTIRLIMLLASRLRSFPRHLSQHVGGFVITQNRLDELVPIENAAMQERTVIEWDKDDIDALGILKVDCLALGMLSAIRKCFALLNRHHGVELDMAKVLAEDGRRLDDANEPDQVSGPVYDMICEADTVGVFQIESRAQMQMLPRFRPRCFYDLVIEIAIIRPGPIQGGMVHPYLRRRQGLEAIEYPHACTESVLRKTLGIPLFQEQVMQLAVVAAGYTPGEADRLRKDMAAWKRTGSLERHREKLLSGMTARGIGPEFAERLFQQIRGFSSYGFPESHAASFALIAWVSCYLKRYYPAAFMASLINSQPMGFYSVASLVRDAREHGVEVRPPDVNFSHFDCTLEEASQGLPDTARASWGAGGPALRLGLRCVRSVSQDAVERIVAVRERGGRFVGVEDFARRTDIDRRQLAALARGDAFASMGIGRREALWAVKEWEKLPPLFRHVSPLSSARLSQSQVQPPLSHLSQSHCDAVELPSIELPSMRLHDHVVEDYISLGLSLRAHPIALIRPQLDAEGVTPSVRIRAMADGSMIEVVGIVLCRQRPGTASGVVFMTIEDECGVMNIIIWARVFERCRQAVRASRLVRICGKVQRDPSGKVTNIIADDVAELNSSPAAAHTMSRDFH